MSTERPTARTIIDADGQIYPDRDFLKRRVNSAMTAKVHSQTRHYRVFNITVKDAVNRMPKEAIKSMYKEVKQMVDKKVWKGVNLASTSYKHQKKVIKSFMFLKEKFKSNGLFEKLKARLVGGGHMQNRELIPEDLQSSPTASLPFVFMVAAIAARDGRHVRTCDIGGAYLNADISSQHILMELDASTSAILLQIDPSYNEFMRPNGTIVVELQKALYGLVESGKLWYDLLSATLQGIGYEQNPMDKCIFNKIVDGIQSTVCIYVDDLMVTSKDLSMVQEVIDTLKSKFQNIEIHDGPVHSYLGMSWDFSKPGEVKVTAEGYTEDLLKWADIDDVMPTPAASHLFDVRNSQKLSVEDSKWFHSGVAKLLYLAKRVRPDIILPVSFLSTRVQSADTDDMKKLIRVFKYLNGTRELGVILKPNDILSAFIDSSYGIHIDGKSHSGMVITLGLGALFIKSTKQKIVTKSSTEAELVALSDMCSPVIWSREFLIAQGEKPPPVQVHQDNQSTIALTANGQSNSDRTRHIKVRYFWIKDRVDEGDIEIIYTPTEDMVADILTKPLQGEQFTRLRQLLLNWSY